MEYPNCCVVTSDLSDNLEARIICSVFGSNNKLVEENTLFAYKKIAAEYVIAENRALGSQVSRMRIWILSLNFGREKALSQFACV